jgi:hypothetical protein
VRCPTTPLSAHIHIRAISQRGTVVNGRLKKSNRETAEENFRQQCQLFDTGRQIPSTDASYGIACKVFAFYARNLGSEDTTIFQQSAPSARYGNSAHSLTILFQSVERSVSLITAAKRGIINSWCPINEYPFPSSIFGLSTTFI